ncbi:putative ferulic acid Esterase/Feruloyl esterase precursor, partial [Aureobasidium melanogenum]
MSSGSQGDNGTLVVAGPDTIQVADFYVKASILHPLVIGSIAIIVLFTSLRFFSNRSIAAMNVTDWIANVAIGSTLAGICNGNSLVRGLLSLCTILGFQYLMSFIGARLPSQHGWILTSPPIIIAFRGKLLTKVMLISSIFHFSSKNTAGSAAAAASTVQAAASSSVSAAISTATSTSASAAAATSSSAAQAVSGCQALIQALSFPDQQVYVVDCEDITAGTALTLPNGPSNCNGGSVQIDLRRVTLNVVTSYASSNYVEVWLPNGQDAWNGRFMATDNKGLSGCPSYDDMIYTSSLGFSVVGDNGGHNNTEYLGMDAQQFLNNNELVIDWSYRARHAAVVAGKQVIKTNYGHAASYNYMIGCSNGGRQALQSAQMF